MEKPSLNRVSEATIEKSSPAIANTVLRKNREKKLILQGINPNSSNRRVLYRKYLEKSVSSEQEDSNGRDWGERKNFSPLEKNLSLNQSNALHE